MRSSRVGMPGTASDIPVPRLSNCTTRAKVPSSSRKRAMGGSSQNSSQCENSPHTSTRSSGPSPHT
jgi:hypothetical protein